LAYSIELRHAPFFGWINDLSAQDPFYVTPVLLGVAMFVQQKLTPNATMDKNQEKIMLMMPVIFSVMMISLPAGLVIYMIANSIISIAQQQYLNRKLA
jgi:YidC/Oxa1 family membrane protein insertase